MGKLASLSVAVVITLLYCSSSAALPNGVDLEGAIQFTSSNVNKSKAMETNIVAHGTVLHVHRPEFRAYLDSHPTREALQSGSHAHLVVETSVYLSSLPTSKDCLIQDNQKCAKYISQFSLKDTSLGPVCAAEHKATCDQEAHYRTFNGECNNIKNPVLGRAKTAYGRALVPNYSRGIEAMKPSKRIVPNTLSNPRTISVKVSTPSGEEENSVTLAVMQWAQFIANDLSLTPVRKMLFTDKTIVCCDPNGRQLSPRYEHDFCAPIDISEDDPVYGSKWIRCLNYVRSLPAFNPQCSFGAMEQMNEASHFLDASTIYGTTEEKARSLRTLEGGQLRVNSVNGNTYLPASKSHHKSECQGDCYDAGDVRVNDQPQLTALHTVFVREHNRIARQIAKSNSALSDEVLYQEARRRVVAEIQHITYNEFLPALLGSVGRDVAQGSYSASESPEVNNEVATAALRFFNSLVQEVISLPNQGSLRLSENFFNPHVVESNLDGLLLGLATQLSQKMDVGVVSDLTSKFYAVGNNLGSDVLSLDIQRGRDHGFQGYNAYRKHCGLPVAEKFEDLTNIPSNVIGKLKELYSAVNDIDLIVGGFAEVGANGILGRTFECLLSEQFKRTRRADRYFYDNPKQPYPFTPGQLSEIRKVTLASIFCGNGNKIEKIQPNVFLKPGAGNEVKPCSQIPQAK